MLGMTGYAKKVISLDEWQIEIEVKSYNNRFLDISLHLPSEAGSFEQPIRRLIEEKISRGRIEFSLHWNKGKEELLDSLEIERIKKLLSRLQGLQKELKIEESVTFSHLISLKELFVTEPYSTPFEFSSLSPHCKNLLESLYKEHRKEGEITTRSIKSSIEDLQQRFFTVESETSLERTSLLERTIERWEKLKKESSFDTLELEKERVEQEIAIQIVKHDINEEVVRLRSFIETSRAFLEEEESIIAKKFDFLCQEMGRECNTISAKSRSPLVAKEIVEMKLLIEQIREQLRNVQ